MKQIDFLEALQQDIRYGLRTMWNHKGLTFVASVTLALGIGANTAIFSVLYAVLLQPLRYRNPSELVWATDRFPKMQTAFVPHPSYFAWRERNRVFSGVAAYDAVQDMNLSTPNDAARVSAAPVSANFFSLLGVELTLGRRFLDAEDAPGGPRAAILSYSLWMSRFNANSDILGQPIALNDRSYSVVGVLPMDFRFPDPGIKGDLFIPLRASSQIGEDGAIRQLSVIARLRPDVTSAQAAVNLSVIEPGVIAQYPKWFDRYSQETKVEVIPLRDRLVGSVRLPMISLLLAVGVVLLIGCINVANLQLARVTARQREIAVRAALGAGRRRLAGQLLTESGLLALLGGAGGVIWAVWGIQVLCAFVPKSILAVNPADVHINPPILIFALMLTASSGILVGLAPGIAAVRPDLNQAMKVGGGRQGFDVGQTLFRNLLMSGEIFGTVVLLTAAGLFLKSFVRLSQVNPGFSSEGIFTAQVFLSQRRYGEPERQATFFQQLLDRTSTLPGVRYAAVTDRLPPDGPEFGRRIAIVGRPEPAPNDVRYSVVEVAVSPDYFRMFEIPLISGRTFTTADSVHSVVVVNQSFVRRFFSDARTALDQGIVAAGTPAPLSIVGVVGDSRNVGLTEPAAPAIFRLFAQRPNPRTYIAVKTEYDAVAAAAMLRHQLFEIDKSQPLYRAVSMQQILEEDSAPARFYMWMSGLIAALALLLAGIGIYGVISYGIAQRTREIGLRVALGATRCDTVWLIFRQGLPWILGGILAGAGTALAGTRFLGSLLYGVKPADPWTLLSAVCLLALAVLAAFYVPVRRAMSVDPVVALRQE